MKKDCAWTDRAGVSGNQDSEKSKRPDFSLISSPKLYINKLPILYIHHSTVKAYYAKAKSSIHSLLHRVVTVKVYFSPLQTRAQTIKSNRVK
jgi:hypothetical protein